MLPYSIAADSVFPLTWCVRYRGRVVVTGISSDALAEAMAAERNEGAVKLASRVDAEARCFCGDPRWKCARDGYSNHAARAGT